MIWVPWIAVCCSSNADGQPVPGCDHAFSLAGPQELGRQAQGSPHGHRQAQGHSRGAHAHQGPVDATPARAAAFVEEVPATEEDRQTAVPLPVPPCQRTLGKTSETIRQFVV